MDGDKVRVWIGSLIISVMLSLSWEGSKAREDITATKLDGLGPLVADPPR